MLPEQFQIKEYQESVKLLEEIRKELDEGNILSVLVIAETTSGDFWSGCTSTQNVFSLAGMLMFWAMRRLGFVDEKQIRERPL